MFGAPYRLGQLAIANSGDGPQVARGNGTFSGRLPREFHLLLGRSRGRVSRAFPTNNLTGQPDFALRPRSDASERDFGRSAETG